MDKDQAEGLAEKILVRARAARPAPHRRRDRVISRTGFALCCAGLGFGTGLCVGSAETQWDFAVMGLAMGVVLGVLIAGQRALSFVFSDSPEEASSGRLWSGRASGLIGLVVGGGWFLVNLRHVAEQRFVAIGLPLVIFTLGAFYFFRQGGGDA